MSSLAMSVTVTVAVAVIAMLSCSRVHAATVVTTSPQVLSVDPPWLAVLHCFKSDSPSSCFQHRAVRALEDLLPDTDSDTDNDDDNVQVEKSAEMKGVSPGVSRLIDRIGELIASGISQWYPEDPQDLESAKSNNSVDQARGHHKKKKVHKAIKKIVIKFLMFLYVMQQAIRLFMYSAQTFILFKFMLLAGVYVLTNVLKVWTLVSWHHHEKHAPKVLYIEPKIKHVTQHHDVHDVHAHHEHQEYSPDGYEYEPSAHDSGLLWPRSDDAHRLAYYKQIPSNAAQGTPQYTP